MATHLHLNTLKEFSDWEMAVRNTPDSTYHALYLTFRDDYSRHVLTHQIRFNNWVRDAYPTANWPYRHPTQFDEFTQILEEELQNQVENIKQLNRSLTFSNYGRVTYILTHAETIAYDERAPLLALRDQLWTYSQIQGCNTP
jgi:hypothetical protein